MKIKLNENECYELKLKDEYTKEEFFEILNRFNILAKMFCKDDILTISKNPNQLKNTTLSTRKRKWNRCSREQIVEITKVYYFDRNNFQNICQKYNFVCSNNISYWTKRYNILSTEIGLIEYPTWKNAKDWSGGKFDRWIMEHRC